MDTSTFHSAQKSNCAWKEYLTAKYSETFKYDISYAWPVTANQKLADTFVTECENYAEVKRGHCITPFV